MKTKEIITEKVRYETQYDKCYVGKYKNGKDKIKKFKVDLKITEHFCEVCGDKYAWSEVGRHAFAGCSCSCKCGKHGQSFGVLK